MKAFEFPPDFLLGSATAACQIEGSCPDTNWVSWHEAGRIQNDNSPLTHAGHSYHVEEDLDLLAHCAQQSYRLSIEWARIEPQQGIWSDEGLAYYLDELHGLRARGILPLVTLHHFSNPQWFDTLGQWTNPEAPALFCRFVERVVRAFGDLANEYCTINEPNVYCMSSFIDGDFPPGDKDNLSAYFKATRQLIRAHIDAYTLIHRLRQEMGFSDTRVGFAMHYTALERHPRHPLTAVCKKGMDYLFHRIFEAGFIEGRLLPPLGLRRVTPCLSSPVSNKYYVDFIGINYYTRHIIYPSKNPATLFGEPKTGADLPADRCSDMGWEIYPEGLDQICKRVAKRYPAPLYITENGIADASDKLRPLFLLQHLNVCHRLIQAGVKLQRYYYWSFWDNLEWNFGYWPRFGLIELDYESGARHMRPSAELYRKICLAHGISEAILKDYAVAAAQSKSD